MTEMKKDPVEHVRRSGWYRTIRAVYVVIFTSFALIIAAFVWSSPQWSRVDVQNTVVQCLQTDRTYLASDVDLAASDLYLLVESVGTPELATAWRKSLVGEIENTELQKIVSHVKVQNAYASYSAQNGLSESARNRLAFLCGFDLEQFGETFRQYVHVEPVYEATYSTMNKIVFTHLALVMLYVVFEMGRRWFYQLAFGRMFP